MIYIQNSNVWINPKEFTPSIKIVVYKSHPFSYRLEHHVQIRSVFYGGMFNYDIFEDFCLFRDCSSEWGNPKYIYRRSRELDSEGRISYTFSNKMLDKHIT